jgi:hypothetical protein
MDAVILTLTISPSEINYDIHKDNDEHNINKIYLDLTPPLKIMYINKNQKYFIYSRDKDFASNLKSKFSDDFSAEKENWESINKQSISMHIDFLKDVKSKNIKKTAKLSLYDLLDKKIIKYIQKNFKSYSKYSENMIVYEDGTEMCKFYEFLKIPILFKNKISGEKYDFSIKKNNSIKNGFDIECHVNGKELNITFKPYKGKLVVIGLSSGYQVNPKSWEIAVSTIATAWNEYPEDIDNIDVDLLEKL